MSTFSEKLKQSTNEDKQVNKYYIEEIKKTIPRISNNESRIDTDVIIHPEIKTDGIYRCYYIHDELGIEYNYLLQIECKLDIDFSDAKARANVLLQVCCYLKQIHEEILGYNYPWESNQIPKVIVLGSKINCLALPTKILLQFAQSYIEGYNSASTAYLKPENAIILINIAEDSAIQAQSIVYDTSDKNCITRLCEEIIKLGKGLKITDDLNEHTVSIAFDFFDMYVLEQKFSAKLSSREKVDLFIGIFFNEEFEEAITRGSKSTDKLRIHGTEIKVNPDKYNQFKLLYNMREYSRLEQKQITAIADRLIEDTDRRRKGDFYTPSIWVDEAHKLLDKNLGENWRNEYMVWDCAWGTGNLTRDYQFSDLYCSTLQQEDLNIATRYNKNAVKFQYDFLNDDVVEMEQIRTELRRPLLGKTGINLKAMKDYINFANIHELYEEAVRRNVITQEESDTAYNKALEILHNTKLYKSAPSLIEGLLGTNTVGVQHNEEQNSKKKLLFLINPPYKGAGSGHGKSNTEGVTDTLISKCMKDEKIAGSGQLYNQFLYRMLILKSLFNCDMNIGVFSPSQILNSVQLKDIRMKLMSIGYSGGFMLQASNFANVADNWGISFTLWGLKNKKITCLDILDLINGAVSIIQKDKVIKMLEKDEKALYWVKSTENKEKETIPRFTSAINYDTSRHYEREKGALATLIMDMGIVESNLQRCAIMPSRSNANWSIIDVTCDNFDKIMSFFAARRMIVPTWINSKDEYMIPNTEHPLYEQWQSDCIVYSLFNTASNQSSLRNIDYNNKTWNIQNEFFWMPVKEISNLAGGLYNKEDTNTAIEDDIEAFGKERFVYKKLQTVTLSPDAQAVLDKATELVKTSFMYRKEFNQKHHEYHINTWDAGWYQIKGMLKEYDHQGLKEFNNLYKQLEDRMRPLVYELGFLYK